jgi:hypothetical protein
MIALAALADEGGASRAVKLPAQFLAFSLLSRRAPSWFSFRPPRQN